jgi:hypothetical protein
MSLSGKKKLMHPEDGLVVCFTHLRRISMSQSITSLDIHKSDDERRSVCSLGLPYPHP